MAKYDPKLPGVGQIADLVDLDERRRGLGVADEIKGFSGGRRDAMGATVGQIRGEGEEDIVDDIRGESDVRLAGSVGKSREAGFAFPEAEPRDGESVDAPVRGIGECKFDFRASGLGEAGGADEALVPSPVPEIGHAPWGCVCGMFGGGG